MSSTRLVLRSVRPSILFARPMSTTSGRLAGNSEHPSGTQSIKQETSSSSELGVGELEGASFKIEPLRRTGEDANTTRARLLYQSRKRGTLESDLLMSTFADTYLPHMSIAQMAQYDRFLDENDWDIYYWATQEPTPTSAVAAEGSGTSPQGVSTTQEKVSSAQKEPELETDAWRQGQPRSGEWAQTVGTYKPAYRPVPARWKNSEILSMLRRHVISKSAGGVHEEIGGEGLEQSVKSTGGGMAFMPPVFQTDRP